MKMLVYFNLLAEYNLNSKALKETYAWGLDLSGSIQGAGGVGGLLSVTDHTTQVPLTSYPTYDGNGNISEYLADINDGSILAHYEYDAFGNVTKKTGNGEYSYQFSTKPFDSLTGLNYYNFRLYDGVSGRWINRDLIEEEGGLNLYAFVNNAASGKVDILGNNSQFDEPSKIPGKLVGTKPNSNCLGLACQTGDVATRQPKPSDEEPETDDEMMKRLANCKPIECEMKCESPHWLVALWVDEKGQAFHAAARPKPTGWVSQLGVGGGVYVVPPDQIDDHVNAYQKELKHEGKLTKKCYCCCKKK